MSRRVGPSDVTETVEQGGFASLRRLLALFKIVFGENCIGIAAMNPGGFDQAIVDESMEKIGSDLARETDSLAWGKWVLRAPIDDQNFSGGMRVEARGVAKRSALAVLRSYPRRGLGVGRAGLRRSAVRSIDDDDDQRFAPRTRAKRAEAGCNSAAFAKGGNGEPVSE